ncbi:hypothetical protein B7463_g1480, partial [Scytalidium lignicola]
MYFVWIFMIFAVSLTAFAQTCYWPNGDEAPNSLLCPSREDKAYSACCFADDYCLSNGLCFDPSSLTMYRGSCTDAKFESQSCGQYCYGSNFENGADNQQCGVWTCGDNKFACDIRMCNTGNFTVPSGTIQLNAAIQTDIGSIPATTTVTSEAGKATVTTTVLSTSTVRAEPKGDLSAGAGAGIGVGIGLPLLIAASALFVLFLRERRKGQEYRRELDKVALSIGLSYAPLRNTQTTGVNKDMLTRSELIGNYPQRYELQT